MHPLDPALTAKRVGQPVEAVADNTVDPPNTGCREDFSKLIGDGFCHLISLLLERFRNASVGLLSRPVR
jgi:hypothetical protein